ncbi:MAG TPA: glycosyltransferase family 39 protein [Gemmataceae bacterium]|nr:glycosyltransferase family 39 protein [Gemmataceae bacterium]
MFAFRRLGVYECFWLLVVVIVAMAARVWYLNEWADGGRSSGPLQVQGTPPPSDLKAILANLTENRQFASRAPLASAEEQTAHVSPGYPWLMAWIDRVPASLGTLDRTMRWLQCLLGTLTALIYALLARRAFGSMAVAVVTGLLCAVHPFWIVNTAEINDGVVVSFLLGLSLWLGARSAQDGGLVSSFFFGVVLAGMGMTRAACLPFVFVALLWFVGRCRVVRRGWLCAFLATLGLLNALLPWTFRNYRLFGEVVPIVSSAPFHIWMGNNPQATGGPMDENAMLASLAESRNSSKQDVEQTSGALPQKARYDQLVADARAEVQRHPAETIRRRLLAGIYFWFGADWLKNDKCWETESVSTTESPGFLVGNATLILNGMLLFMVIFGLLGWRWTSRFSLQAMPTSLALIWFPLSYIVGHAAGLVGPRLPLDGVVLCYAAFALACLLAPHRSGLLRSARL